jgi:hypothetical protein
MKYEEIKATKISDLPELTVKKWIMDEISDLANDFGQKIDNETNIYIARRLYDVLTNRFRSWYVGDVHACFQTGLTGGYGKFSKVTVQTLLYFLKRAENNLIVQSVYSQESKKYDDRIQGEAESRFGDFILWCTKNNIYADNVDPEWNVLETHLPSPKMVEICNEYHEAKEMDVLDSLKTRLKKQYVWEEEN